MKVSTLLASLLMAGVLCAACSDDEKNEPKEMVITFEGSYWQSLIDTKQNGGPLLYGSTASTYSWTDEATTLTGGMTNEWGGTYGFAEGGVAISNYITPKESNPLPDADHQLEVMSGNGSATFAVVFCNAGLRFADDKSHLIRSMEVCPTSYVHCVAKQGSAYAKALTEANDFLTIHITANTGTKVDVDLVKGGKLCEGWQRIDLSPLGEVKEIKFTMTGSDMGEYGLNTPTYFALDNIVVGR